MAQTIALQARAPDIDLSTPLLRAEEIRRARMQNEALGLQQEGMRTKNQLSALELAETQGRMGALGRYRSAAQAGDKGALDELAGYPKIQADFFNALNSMKPSEKKAAEKRASTFGKSARYIASFPAGSVDRKAAELREIKKLRDQGLIDENQYQEWARTGVSDMLLNEAMTVEQWVKAQTKGDKDLSASDLVKVDTPEGPRYVPAPQAVGRAPYEKPTKPSAMEGKIEEIQNSFGVDRKTAAGIATGTISIKTDPVSGSHYLVNAATGEAQMLSYQGSTVSPTATREGSPEKSSTEIGQDAQSSGNTLWNSVDGVPGVVGWLTEQYGRVAGQVPGVDIGAGPTEIMDNRQMFRLAQNDLIRSLSINPRFPVAEMNRIKGETDIEPNIWDSPAAIKARMDTLDGFLRNRLQNERRAAQDRELPVDTRQAAAQAVNDITNFLGILGVPKNGAPVAEDLQRVFNDDDYDPLPSGTEFIDPDGNTRRKP